MWFVALCALILKRWSGICLWSGGNQQTEQKAGERAESGHESLKQGTGWHHNWWLQDGNLRWVSGGAVGHRQTLVPVHDLSHQGASGLLGN
jgi:hypothetical protein